MRKQQNKKILLKSLILNTIFSFLIGVLFTFGLFSIISKISIGAGVGLMLASICLCVIYVITRIKYSLDPLAKLLGAFADLAAGNLDADFSSGAYASDSVAKLGENMSQLASDMKSMLAQEKNTTQLQDTILSSLNDGIIATDRRGLIKLETPLVGELLGKKSKDKLDTELRHIFLKNINYNHVWTFMAQAMDRNESIKEEINITLDDSNRVIEAYAIPLELNNTSGVLAVLRDITHVKQLENIRKEFVANVSHELKTPLTSIIGYVDLLKNTDRSAEEKQQFYEIISIETDRLQMLIADLLDLSEIEGGDRQRNKAEEVHVFEVADEVFEELSGMAAKNEISLHLDVDPDFVLIANRTRIKQIVSNLVSNAIKYNKPKGDVWVKSKIEKGRLMLIVEDNGLGIPEDDQDRIFERFYRVNKSRSREIGGTGLGLSIVKHITNLYGGNVLLDSAEGKGTSFTVIFPAYRS